MAKTRPFTYNNGDPILDNLQIGNLAFGFLNDTNSGTNYDDNPGGKKWWMGPDEENKYIIGKDVPTEDQPTQTPEGDIGSVEFWATTGENDTQFINLTNIISNNSFSTTQAAYGWLEENGYFTNYPYLGEQTSSLWTRVRAETKTNNTYNSTFARYISSSDSLIIGNGYSDYVSFNNQGLKGNIYNFPSNNIISGSTISIDYTSSYILPGSSSRYKSTSIYGTDIDYENNKLFARIGNLIGSTTSYLVKYDLDNNSIEDEIIIGTDKFNDASEEGFLHYEPYNNRLYNFYYSSSTPHLQVYNASNLTYINEYTGSGFDVSSNDYVNSNPHNGEFLVIEPNITPDRIKIWNFNNVTSPTQTTISLDGFNWSFHNEIERPSSIRNLGTSMNFKCQFPFSTTQKRYYIPGFQSETNYDNYSNKGNAILVIDAINKSIVDVIYLGGIGFPNGGYNGGQTSKGVFLSGPLGGVYDELRDYIWTINFDNKLVVISCKTHQIVGKFEIDPFNFDEELSGNGSIPNSYNVPWLSLDNNNKRLYISTKLQAIRVYDITDVINELP